MSPLIIRSVVLKVLIPIWAVLALSACRSVQSASFSPAAHDDQSTVESRPSSSKTEPVQASSRWPARWGDNPDQRGTIIVLDPADPLRPIHLSRFHQFRSTDVEYNDANQLAADIGITSGFRFKPEGPGSFLFVPNPKNDSTPDLTIDSGKQSPSDLPDLAFKFVSATKIDDAPRQFEFSVDDPETSETKTIKVTAKNSSGLPHQKFTSEEDHVNIQRTWFTYRDPKEKQEHADPVGTIVLLPGMFGTPDVIVDALENYWHHQGYAILRMRSHPSRFTAHTRFTAPPEIVVQMTEKLARMNDDRVAECAYATDAALDHVLELRPALEGKPTILVGMSGGAMMLPTIYAYAPERYQGAVLIAGGANFLEISIDSNYRSWIDAITFDFAPGSSGDGEITGEIRERFLSEYLLKSKLDPYHTATEMTDIPVLMLHASADKAVPASTGQLLYQQLNEPERWSYPIGHELIFAGLPTQVARIDNWITKQVLEASTD